MDGMLTSHYQVNYTLRGLDVPSGEHIITFKFEPKVIQTGSYISIAGHLILVVLLIFGGWKFYMEETSKRANG